MEYEDYYFIYGEPGKTPYDKEDFLKDDFLFKEIEKADEKQVKTIYSILRKERGYCEFKDEDFFPLQKKKKVLNLMLQKINNFNDMSTINVSLFLNDVLDFLPNELENNKILFLNTTYHPLIILHQIEFIDLFFKNDTKKRKEFINDLIDRIVDNYVLKMPSIDTLKPINVFINYLEKDGFDFFKAVKTRYPSHYKNKMSCFFNIVREEWAGTSQLFENEVENLLSKAYLYLKNNNEDIKLIISTLTPKDSAHLNKTVVNFLIEHASDAASEIHQKMQIYYIKEAKKRHDYKIPYDKLNSLEKRIIMKNNEHLSDVQNNNAVKQKKRI